MPELPEVETFTRQLRPALVGKKIHAAELLWKRTLATPFPKEFNQRIVGQTIHAVKRRAKYIHIELSQDHLFIHLRMSGDVYVKDADYKTAKHDRLILTLTDLTPNPSPKRRGENKFIFNDTRKFGRVWLVSNPDEVIGNLGVEPFDEIFTSKMLFEMLKSRNRQLKPLLLDQTFIAGLGNIYTDESLHYARLHPLQSANSVTARQADKLHEGIRLILQNGIDHNGASIDWVYRGGEFQNHFSVYGRTDEPCPRCKTKIKHITVGQRTTHYCPKCQKLEK